MARKNRRNNNNNGNSDSGPDREAYHYQNPDVVYVNTLEDNVEKVEVRNESQRKFIQTLKKYDITVCTGPAGTGKSFLSVAMALQALKSGSVQRIILTRPIIEAGEKLGYLPGDFHEKIDPYLRPLYDALNYLLGPDGYKKLMSNEIIEICPIAYMRGRTFENSYIIVDEAQNTTLEQIIMVATRLGEGSKMVINGDVTQIDLPKSKESGLILLEEILRNSPNIGHHEFLEGDVVRHPLVKEVVMAVEAWKKAKTPERSKKPITPPRGYV